MEKLSDCQSQHVSVPVQTLGKGTQSFSRPFALNKWLTVAYLTHGFLDYFYIFWNCKDRIKPDGIHPNITGCRLVGATQRHVILIQKIRIAKDTHSPDV